MSEYRKLVERAESKGAGEEAWAITEEFIERLCKKHPEIYNELMESFKELAYKITPDEAERMVREMRPRGQQWSHAQVKDFIRAKGIDKNCTNWYLVMNMVYNDYYETAKAYGLQNDAEFFFCLAKDFIEDPDAKPLKVEKYFLG